MNVIEIINQQTAGRILEKRLTNFLTIVLTWLVLNSNRKLDSRMSKIFFTLTFLSIKCSCIVRLWLAFTARHTNVHAQAEQFSTHTDTYLLTFAAFNIFTSTSYEIAFMGKICFAFVLNKKRNCTGIFSPSITLWFIFINNAPESSEGQVCIYADDTVLYVHNQ